MFLLEGLVGWFWIWGMVKESFSDFGFGFNFNVIFWLSVGLVLFWSGFGVLEVGNGDIVKFIFCIFLLDNGSIILLYNGIFLSCWLLVFVFVGKKISLFKEYLDFNI